MDEKLAEISGLLQEKLEELQSLPENPALAQKEPDDLTAIRALRPNGKRRIRSDIPNERYLDSLHGGSVGGCAGYMLGAPVEFYNGAAYKSTDLQQGWAQYIGDEFPPQDYWSKSEGAH